MEARPTTSKSPSLLPPIINGGPFSEPHTPMASKQPDDNKWSRFHSGCISKESIYMDWNAKKPEKKPTERGTRHLKTRSVASFKDATEREIVKYLDLNKEFLESYVVENVSFDIVERWFQKKLKIHAMTSPLKNKIPNLRLSKKDLFLELISVMKDEPTDRSTIWELAIGLSATVGVDAYGVFKLYPDHPTVVKYFDLNGQRTHEVPNTLVRVKEHRADFVLSVANEGKCVHFSKLIHSRSFPVPSHSLCAAFNLTLQDLNHVIYVPILNRHGRTIYVIELWRSQPYTEIEEEICSTFLVLGSMSMHFSFLYVEKEKETTMSEFLLEVVKAIFEEMVSLDQLIKRILEFAQQIVNADRASLFLVDNRNYELVSTVFDLKFESGLDRDIDKKEIRMPIHRGIAGYVATSGETMNISDAYSDYRFNREVDEATGYRTSSILCIPIKIEGRVIGVVQMVNKRGDGSYTSFGPDDEVSFAIFSTFFGLAIHHARLYDRILRNEQKYRVAIEVLSYHNTCRENEVQNMLDDIAHARVDLNDFYLDPFKFDEFYKCKCVITMFDDLFNLSDFDLKTLMRFILTVKKNYRDVPYHNFDHGWSVAHAMYVILKKDTLKRFDYKTRLALFVACLCHDLDHRGYTNKYMSETASPLAAMYTTSTLEHHHFNITVTILQQDNHNIFAHISIEDYKEILGLIRQCILATDLAAFFPNLEKIQDLCADNSASQFSWGLQSHRDLAMAISMTAADLSASSKPWDVQIKTVKVIFAEFYDQGDKERAAGRTPIPMMDRHQPEQQPASQVGFLSQICIPCYSVLHKILPNTQPMLSMASKNLDHWQAKAEHIQRKLKRSIKREQKAAHVKGKEFKETSGNDGSTDKLEKASSVPDDTMGSLSWEEEEEDFTILKKLPVMKKEKDNVSWIDDDEGVVVVKATSKAPHGDKK